MKKYKILISAILVIANLLSFGVVSLAAEPDYVLPLNSNATEYTYKAWAGSGFYEEYANLKNGDKSGRIDISELYIDLQGAYVVSMVAATADEHSWQLEFNGQAKTSKKHPSSGGYTKYAEEKVGIFEFNKDTYNLIIWVYNDETRIKEIRFTKTTAPTITEVKANVGEFGDTVSAGADTFSLVFDNEMADDGLGSITLSSAEKTLKTDYYVDGEKVVLNLLESLEADTEYTLSVGGFSDAYGLKMADTEPYTFTAVDDGLGEASVEIESTSCDGLAVEVSGTVYSSAKKGIENRAVKAVFNDEEMAADVSGEDGAFSMSFSLPDSIESGQHTVYIKSDYADDADFNVEYYTQGYEEELLADLLGTTTYQEARDILKNNAATLGIDVTNDTKLLRPAALFAYFVGLEAQSISLLKEYYYKILYLETVNQARNVSNVKSFFESEEKSNKLGIDYNYYRVIASDAFLQKIVDLDVFATPEDLVVAYNELANAEIEEMFGLSDITVEASVESVYVGQKAELKLNNTVTDAKIEKISVEAKFDKSFDPEFVSELDYELSETDDGYKVVFDLSNEGATEGDLGQFEFLGTQAGTYSGTLEGNVYYKVDADWDKLFEYSVADDTFDIIVNSKTEGGGGTTTGAVNTSRPKNNNSRPSSSPSVPIIPVTPPAETEFKFTDIDGVSWAQESIYGLLEKNIISENSAKEFRPNDSITRAEFIKLLAVATGIYDENAKAEMNDVSEGAWYYSYMASAVLNNLVTGDENKNIKPEEFISRQDMAVIAFRAFGYEALNENEEFADDNEISEYAKAAVYTLRSKGVINGRGENMYAPRENVTRAEAAKIIFNLI